MRTAAVFAFLAVFVAVAFAVNPTKCNNTLDSGVDELHASLVEAERTFNEVDFLRVPFDPVNNAEDKQIFEFATSSPKFADFRETAVRMNFQMTVAEYDAQHAKARAELIAMAKDVKVDFAEEKESFTTLLARVETVVREQSGSAEGTSLIETRMTQVAALRESAHVFAGVSTMHEAVVEHAIMFNVNEVLNKALAYTKNSVQKNKCKWCQSIIKWIKKSACSLAGDFICGALSLTINAVVPGGSVPFKKWVCGWPIKLADMFGKLCVRGVEWVQKKTGFTDDCFCSLIKIPNITIGAINLSFPMSIKTPRTTIIMGQICPKRANCFKAPKKPAPKPTGKAVKKPASKTAKKPVKKPVKKPTM